MKFLTTASSLLRSATDTLLSEEHGAGWDTRGGERDCWHGSDRSLTHTAIAIVVIMVLSAADDEMAAVGTYLLGHCCVY